MPVSLPSTSEMVELLRSARLPLPELDAPEERTIATLVARLEQASESPYLIEEECQVALAHAETLRAQFGSAIYRTQGYLSIAQTAVRLHLLPEEVDQAIEHSRLVAESVDGTLYVLAHQFDERCANIQPDTH